MATIKSKSATLVFHIPFMFDQKGGGRHHMVVGFITTYAIGAYYH
jgi:hypothetical protein